MMGDGGDDGEADDEDGSDSDGKDAREGGDEHIAYGCDDG